MTYPRLQGMGELFCHEANLPFDLGSVVETARNLIESSDTGVILIGDGAMAGALSYPMYMNSTLLLQPRTVLVG